MAEIESWEWVHARRDSHKVPSSVVVRIEPRTHKDYYITPVMCA